MDSRSKMKRHVVLPVAITVFAIIAAAINVDHISSLQLDNQQLQTTKTQSDRFADENRQFSDSTAAEELKILRAETRDLHKLRAEVQRLRSLEKEVQPLRDWNIALHQLADPRASSQSQQPLPFVAASELKLVGRSTPEAALQSLLAALREGNLGEVGACMAPLPRAGETYPTYVTRIISGFYGDAAWTAEDKAIEMKAFAAGLNSYRIVEQKPVAPEKIALTLHMTTLDPQGNLQDLTDVNLEATLIDSEWKIGPGRQR